jgi:long-subunit acyl-CoA synthetase (AMP-forming)
MDKILANCRVHADAPMVEVLVENGAAKTWSYGEILRAAQVLCQRLQATEQALGRKPQVGLVARNSPEWVAADLALLLAENIEIPVPMAFAAEQAWHLLKNADICLVDAAGQSRLQQWQEKNPDFNLPTVIVLEINALLEQAQSLTASPAPHTNDDHLCKVIHTSGTTSAPKGVRIRCAGIDALIASLDRRLAVRNNARYLSMVPLSLLIEQVTGLYMTFFDGGTVVFLPQNVPLLGESGGKVGTMLGWITAARPTTMALPPAMVEALLAKSRAFNDANEEARFMRLFGHNHPTTIGVGGAPTSPAVLQELKDYGITVLEGYGLSENGSVVAFNAPGCYRLGTVGKPLDHVQVQIAEDGELLVKSTSLFAGYAGTDPSSCLVDEDGWLHTGDMASMDEDGFIRIFGRKKNLIITANGRNVSPEWVESNYKSLDCVEAAVIFGDRLERLYGFFVISANADLAQAEQQIRDHGAKHLSEVERVEVIVSIHSNASVYDNYFTVTGRPLRDKIWTYVQAHCEAVA